MLDRFIRNSLKCRHYRIQHQLVTPPFCPPHVTSLEQETDKLMIGARVPLISGAGRVLPRGVTTMDPANSWQGRSDLESYDLTRTN